MKSADTSVSSFRLACVVGVLVVWMVIAAVFLYDMTYVDDDEFEYIIHDGPVVITNQLGMTFNYIRPGDFIMGEGESSSWHKVYITSGFYIQTTEVTQGQWEAVMGTNPSFFKSCGAMCPVESVSKVDVARFIKTLNKLFPEYQYRLPTEAEWEFVAVNGSIVNESGLGASCWFTENSGGKTHPVASKSPDHYGLYDLFGNVYEWCEDGLYYYKAIEQIDPLSTKSGKHGNHVVRGGGWRSLSRFCRGVVRSGRYPTIRLNDVGFRLVVQVEK